MTVLDAADLVVIAARTLGIGSDAALAAMDVKAAQAALAEADRPGPEPGTPLPGRAAAAAAGVELVDALLRHHPFPRQNQQIAIAAGLQFLSLNGWRADLNPAETAAVVIEALASGRLKTGDAATWLSPRLSQAPRPQRVRRVPARMPGSSSRLPRVLPAVPAPVGRVAVSALFAGLVGGAALLTAACSHAPGMTSVRTQAVRQAQRDESARPEALAYTACMRTHGIADLPDPSLSGVVAIAPAAAIDPDSPQFRSAALFCHTAVPAAVIHIVTTQARD